jgi:hypothetical protein
MSWKRLPLPLCTGTDRIRAARPTTTTQARLSPRTIPIPSWSEFPISIIGGRSVPSSRTTTIGDTPGATSGKRVLDSVE